MSVSQAVEKNINISQKLIGPGQMGNWVTGHTPCYKFAILFRQKLIQHF
jgi:hypothetical protein